MALDPSGRLAVCGCADGAVALYDLEAGQLAGRGAPAHGDVCTAAVLLEDYRGLVTVCGGTRHVGAGGAWEGRALGWVGRAWRERRGLEGQTGLGGEGGAWRGVDWKGFGRNGNRNEGRGANADVVGLRMIGQGCRPASGLSSAGAAGLPCVCAHVICRSVVTVVRCYGG